MFKGYGSVYVMRDVKGTNFMFIIASRNLGCVSLRVVKAGAFNVSSDTIAE